MIDRYTLPKMKMLWSERHKFNTWLHIQMCYLYRLQDCGYVPKGTYESVSNELGYVQYLDEDGYNSSRLTEIIQLTKRKEAKCKHEMAAFVYALGELGGKDARWIHYGLTSSDILDTEFSYRLTRAIDYINDELWYVIKSLKDRDKDYGHIEIMGRTHGMYAEVTTVGKVFGDWIIELNRHLLELEEIREVINVGMFSGPVGTYPVVDKDVEKLTCQDLHMEVADSTTQVIPRYLYARAFAALGILAASIEKIAVNIRLYARTEVSEMHEGFSVGQKGSSSMPHKQNPIRCENLTGLCRMIRSNVAPALENVVLWHERDMSHSSVERVIAADTTTLTQFALKRLKDILDNLIVNTSIPQARVDENRFVASSHRFLCMFIRKGLTREEAYQCAKELVHMYEYYPQGTLRYVELEEYSDMSVLLENGNEITLGELREAMMGGSNGATLDNRVDSE